MLLLAKDGVCECTAIRTCRSYTHTAHRLTPRLPLADLPTAPRAITQGVLASGNRADVLINCPEGDFEFNSTKMRGAIEEGTLLHIRSVVNNSVPSQCDLPVFKVNRPCCS